MSEPLNFRYPVFLDIRGKRCLVTGAGYEIPPKVKAMVDCGAHVTYVHPTADPLIEELAANRLLAWHSRAFEPSDLDNCFLVITDLDDNSVVFRLAEANNILCNAADDPEFCRFSFGSKLQRDNLTIAISTNGVAPAVAVRIRQRLEGEIGEEYAEFLRLLSSVRQEITESIAAFDRRRELWYRLADSEALQLLRSGDWDRAAALVRELIEQAKLQ